MRDDLNIMSSQLRQRLEALTSSLVLGSTPSSRFRRRRDELNRIYRACPRCEMDWDHVWLTQDLSARLPPLLFSSDQPRSPPASNLRPPSSISNGADSPSVKQSSTHAPTHNPFRPDVPRNITSRETLAGSHSKSSLEGSATIAQLSLFGGQTSQEQLSRSYDRDAGSEEVGPKTGLKDLLN